MSILPLLLLHGFPRTLAALGRAICVVVILAAAPPDASGEPPATLERVPKNVQAASAASAPGASEPLPQAVDSPPEPAAAAPTRGGGELEVFAKALPRAADWVSAPLLTKVPNEVQETIASLSAALHEEGAKTPQASPAAYTLARQICNVLDNALAERQQTLDRYQRMNHQDFFAANRVEAWVNQWAMRTPVFHGMIVSLYGKLGEAVGASAAPPLPSGQIVSADFPPVPNAPALPKQESMLKAGANPLDRGAYDHRRIWSHWWR